MTNREEQLRLEHATLMDEYQALRAEIISTIEAGRQITNYTLVLVGVLAAAAPFLAQSLAQPGSATLLLILPAVFYLLAWTMLRYAILTMSLGDYIRYNVIPKVRACVSAMAPDTPVEADFFGWEEKGKNTLDKYGLLYLPVAGSHFGLPLFGALLILLLYAGVVSSQQQAPAPVDFLLIVANLACFLYSAFWGLRIEHSR